MQITVDTQIFVDANENLSYFDAIRAISQTHTLVLDCEHNILSEYYNNIPKDSLSIKVLKEILTGFKFTKLSSSPSTRHRDFFRISLPSFDPSDHKFIIVAERSSDKTLIAEESDYSDDVKMATADKLKVAIKRCQEFTV